MLSFENICFLKVGNVDISFKLLPREFHSLMADGIHDFYEILVRLRGTDMCLSKFGQIPSTGSENNAQKRSFADTDTDGIRAPSLWFGGYNYGVCLNL